MSAPIAARRHGHYFRKVPSKVIDVYRVLLAFGVDDAAVAHAIKKLLLAGKRGNKTRAQDLLEAMDSLSRSLEMDAEDQQEAGDVG